MEAVVVDAWASALGVPPPSPTDDFFALGGDSFTAMQVLSRIHEQTGVSATLADLVDAPVLRDFVGRLASAPRRKTPVRGGRRRHRSSAPMTRVQHARWRMRATTPTGAEVYWLYEIDGDLDVTALRQAFDELVRRHEILRTTFRRRWGSARQVVHEPRPDVLRVVDAAVELPKRDRTPSAMAQRLFAEEYGAFDYQRGPLLRPTLVVLGSRRFVLSVAANEMVMDAGSRRLFATALSTLYRLLHESGSADDYPEPPVQYGDIARQLRARVGRFRYLEEVGYWKRKLGEVDLDLPVRGRPSGVSGGVRDSSLRLSTRLLHEVRELGRSCSASTFNVLAAAFLVLLRAMTEAATPAFTTTVSNRDLHGADESLGPFFNVLLVALAVDDAQTGTDLVRATAAATKEALVHSDVPFPRIVRLRGQAPSEGWHLDATGVRFQLHDDPGDVELAGVRLRRIPPPFRHSHELYLEASVAGDDTLSLYFAGRSDLPRRVVDGFLPTYRQVVERLTSDPDADVGTLVKQAARGLGL